MSLRPIQLIRTKLTTLAALAFFCSVSFGSDLTGPQVQMTTSAGTIVLELYPDAAPKTVKNFLQYVNSGFYNGTIFHRVIDNFMIQGGGMGRDLKEKKKNPQIVLEAQRAADHGLKNEPGTIAMAREERPDTADSEFFINVANNDFLDPTTIPAGDPVQFMRRGTLRTMPRSQALAMAAGYTVFGRVIAGMDVVNRIKTLPTDRIGENLNVPRQTVTILSVKVLKNRIPVTPPEQPLVPLNSEAPSSAPVLSPSVPESAATAAPAA